MDEQIDKLGVDIFKDVKKVLRLDLDSAPSFYPSPLHDITEDHFRSTVL